MKIKKWEELSKKEKIIGFIIIFTIFSMFVSVFSPKSSAPIKQTGSASSIAKPITKPTAKPTPTRKQTIDKQFSVWDGSHKNLTKLIKESMNNPKSYEHVSTKYWDNKDYLIVETIFRGENAFGGIVKNTIRAKVDLDGNIIKIYE